MKKNRITILALTLVLMGGTTGAIAYAGQNTVDGTKNVVVAAEAKSQQVNGSISDEKAVEIATEALKSYMGKDASIFKSNKIFRTSDGKKMKEAMREKYDKEHPDEVKAAEAKQKKFSEEHPEEAAKNAKAIARNMEDTITVWFNAESNKCANFVEIVERTGEVINVTSINNLDSNPKGQIDDSKVKEATINFLKKIKKDVDEKSISIKNDKERPLGVVDCMLKDGTTQVGIEVNLQDYSVVHYSISDKVYFLK